MKQSNETRIASYTMFDDSSEEEEPMDLKFSRVSRFIECELPKGDVLHLALIRAMPHGYPITVSPLPHRGPIQPSFRIKTLFKGDLWEL